MCLWLHLLPTAMRESEAFCFRLWASEQIRGSDFCLGPLVAVAIMLYQTPSVPWVAMTLYMDATYLMSRLGPEGDIHCHVDFSLAVSTALTLNY